MRQVTADEVRSFLTSLDYPASKEEVVAEAQREGAGDDVLSLLRAMPLGDYASRDDIARSVATVEEGGQSRSRKAAQAREGGGRPEVAERMRTTRD